MKLRNRVANTKKANTTDYRNPWGITKPAIDISVIPTFFMHIPQKAHQEFFAKQECLIYPITALHTFDPISVIRVYDAKMIVTKSASGL